MRWLLWYESDCRCGTSHHVVVVAADVVAVAAVVVVAHSCRCFGLWLFSLS